MRAENPAARCQGFTGRVVAACASLGARFPDPGNGVLCYNWFWNNCGFPLWCPDSNRAVRGVNQSFREVFERKDSRFCNERSCCPMLYVRSVSACRQDWVGSPRSVEFTTFLLIHLPLTSEGIRIRDRRHQ